MTKRSRRLTALTLVGIGVLAIALLARSRSDPYGQQMRPVYEVIAAGEQGWGDEATRMLDLIIARCSDRNALADRLLQESDGSLVAEGMVLATRSNHPQARKLIEQHLGDRRWNWYLANNDELAKQLLLHLDGKPFEPWVAACLSRSAAG